MENVFELGKTDMTAKQDTPAIWSGMKMTRNEATWVERPNDLIV